MAGTGRLGDPREYLDLASLREDRDGIGRVHFTPRARAGQVRRRLNHDPRWPRHLNQSRFTRRTVHRVLDRLAQRHTIDGVLSVKVMWGAYSWMFLAHGLDAGYWGVPVSWVRIQRRDRLAQALSFQRAITTEAWTATMRPTGEPTYDRADIDHAMRFIDHAERNWDTHFTDVGLEPLTVTYEALDADYGTTVRTVLDHLGAAGAPVPPRQLERQADALTAEWRARYLAERETPASAS